MWGKHRLRTMQTHEYVLSSVLTLQMIIAMIVLKLNSWHPGELSDFAIKQEPLPVLPNGPRFCEWRWRVIAEDWWHICVPCFSTRNPTGPHNLNNYFTTVMKWPWWGRSHVWPSISYLCTATTDIKMKIHSWNTSQTDGRRNMKFRLSQIWDFKGLYFCHQFSEVSAKWDSLY